MADRGTVTWTGYGSAAYAQLGAAVAEVKRIDPLAPVTVLVPTNICGIVARRRLAEGVGGRQGVAGLSVLTVDRLAERLAAPALVGSGRRPTTDAVLAAAWRQALADEPGVFAPVAGHPATVRALVTAHRELRDVNEAALFAIAAGGGPVATDLVRLHRTVNARLAGRHYDVADLRREALGGLRRRPDLAGDIGRVVVFLPQDLRLGALALLADILATVGGRVIAGRTGVARADAAVIRTVEGLVPESAAGITMAVPIATTVMHASDADDEVRGVVRRVMTTLRTTPAHRIAVLYGSAQPYARLLAEQFAAAGLARNGAGVSPTLERTLARLLLDLLALPAHGWRRDEVLSLIARATVRMDGRRLPAARWERTSREAGVVAGSDWDTRLIAWAAQHRAEIGPDTDEHRRRAKERDAATADELRLFVAGLRAQLAEGAQLRTWPELARWGAAAFAGVAGELTDGGSRVPEEEVRAAEKIHRTLAGLAGLGALEETADLDALRGTLELELGDDLPRYGTFGRGVLVAPLSESVGLDVDTVIVVGLADDLVPGRLDADALLPEEVRALTGGQLPPPRERVDRQHRHLLAALAAGPAPIASFPRGDLRRSSTRLPSRWLLPTLRAHSGQSTLDASGWHRAAGEFLVGSASFAAALAETAEPATEQEWRTRAAAAGASHGTEVTVSLPDDVALARAVELLRARRSDRLTRFDGDLTGLGVPDPVADAAPIAPTTLELWTRCPHAYFVERLLGIRPVDPPEQIIRASGMHIGSIVHAALDRFHRANGSLPSGQVWTAEHRTQLHTIAEQVAAEFTALGLTGHPLLWREDFIGVLAGLDHLLAQDNAVRAETGRRQVRSELDFGRDGRPPVELALPDGRTLLLKGSADRVDRAGESIVVVDYKTGSTRSFKDLREQDPTARGSKLQLPVYAYAARAALGAPTAPVSAEYWFVGANDDRIGVPLTADVERIFTGTVDVIVRGIAAGLFPHRPPPDDGYGYIPCRYCDPDGLGAGEHRRRWTRKRHDPRLDAYRQLIEPDGEAA